MQRTGICYTSVRSEAIGRSDAYQQQQRKKQTMAEFAVGDKVLIPSQPSLGVCTIVEEIGEGFSGKVYAVSTKNGLQRESASNLRRA